MANPEEHLDKTSDLEQRLESARNSTDVGPVMARRDLLKAGGSLATALPFYSFLNAIFSNSAHGSELMTSASLSRQEKDQFALVQMYFEKNPNASPEELQRMINTGLAGKKMQGLDQPRLSNREILIKQRQEGKLSDNQFFDAMKDDYKWTRSRQLGFPNIRSKPDLEEAAYIWDTMSPALLEKDRSLKQDYRDGKLSKEDVLRVYSFPLMQTWVRDLVQAGEMLRPYMTSSKPGTKMFEAQFRYLRKFLSMIDKGDEESPYTHFIPDPENDGTPIESLEQMGRHPKEYMRKIRSYMKDRHGPIDGPLAFKLMLIAEKKKVRIWNQKRRSGWKDSSGRMLEKAWFPAYEKYTRFPDKDLVERVNLDIDMAMTGKYETHMKFHPRRFESHVAAAKYLNSILTDLLITNHAFRYSPEMTKSFGKYHCNPLTLKGKDMLDISFLYHTTQSWVEHHSTPQMWIYDLIVTETIESFLYMGDHIEAMFDHFSKGEIWDGLMQGFSAFSRLQYASLMFSALNGSGAALRDLFLYGGALNNGANPESIARGIAGSIEGLLGDNAGLMNRGLYAANIYGGVLYLDGISRMIKDIL